MSYWYVDGLFEIIGSDYTPISKVMSPGGRYFCLAIHPYVILFNQQIYGKTPESLKLCYKLRILTEQTSKP